MGFSPIAVERVSPDGAGASPKMPSPGNGLSKPAAEVTTENVGVRGVPVGGTEGAPGPQHLDLHPPVTRCAAVHQPERWGQREMREGGLVLLLPPQPEEGPERQPSFPLLLQPSRAAASHVTPAVTTPSTAQSLSCSPAPAHTQRSTPLRVLTCAGDAGSVSVGARLVPGGSHGAEGERGFTPHTLQLSAPDGTIPFSKGRCPRDRQGCAAPQLPADHGGGLGTKV